MCVWLYTDMEKFPVRMKDNDLLVTELFEDPNKEPITALGVFCPPNHCTYTIYTLPPPFPQLPLYNTFFSITNKHCDISRSHFL